LVCCCWQWDVQRELECARVRAFLAALRGAVLCCAVWLLGVVVVVVVVLLLLGALLLFAC
jgi:hypothetical protein